MLRQGETGLSIQEIRTIIAFLKEAENITIKTTNKYSVITIINWPIYQGEEVENNKQINKPLTTYKHINTKKEKHMRESDDGFASFYESYPVRKGKQPALKAWSKLNPGEDLKRTILEAIKLQERQKSELKERNQFCPEWPYPATWLNQHRWEDEVQAEQSRWER